MENVGRVKSIIKEFFDATFKKVGGLKPKLNMSLLPKLSAYENDGAQIE